MAKPPAAQSDERLGWRMAEFCRLIHVDRATVLKMAKAGQLNLVYFGKCPVIPRTEAIRIGLINV